MRNLRAVFVGAAVCDPAVDTPAAPVVNAVSFVVFFNNAVLLPSVSGSPKARDIFVSFVSETINL